MLFYRLTNDLENINNYFNNDLVKYGEFLYENWIFDIPKLFDFACVYYLSNAMNCNKVISFVFQTQPKYNHDLKHAIDVV